MIVASIIIPIDIAKPPKVIRLALIPISFITIKVNKKDKTNDISTTTDPLKLLNNKYSTNNTRIDPSSKALNTVLMLEVMISERS